MVPVDLGHGEGHAGQPAAVDEQVEGLAGQQRHPVPGGGSALAPAVMETSQEFWSGFTSGNGFD